MPDFNESNTIEIIEKLEMMNSLKKKLKLMNSTKAELSKQLMSAEVESKHLEEFSSELDALNQEKIAHVEELRLIHADINLMETTIRQAREDRYAAVEQTRRLFAEFSELSEQADFLRQALAMEKESDELDDDAHFKQSVEEVIGAPLEAPPERPHLDEFTTAAHLHYMQQQHHQRNESMAAAVQQQQIASFPLASAGPPSAAGPSHMERLLSRNLAQLASLKASLPAAPAPPSHHEAPSLAVSSSVRGQPPPMKSCLSCHQQIHRNAPICPLCKAKSRSRNPKKPKRKADGAAAPF